MARKMKHGDAQRGKRTKEYECWVGMRFRCQNESSVIYKHYGARGIHVCDRWNDPVSGYENFLEDIGRIPGAGYTLDRIDANGNYEPGNCRWATNKEQARNKTNNRILNLDGRSMCIADWAEELGIPAQRISGRLHVGWCVRDALLSPKKTTSGDVSSGARFGRWVVVREAARGKCGQRRYLCKCDCGKTREVNVYSLLHDKSHMCASCRGRIARASQLVAR